MYLPVTVKKQLVAQVSVLLATEAMQMTEQSCLVHDVGLLVEDALVRLLSLEVERLLSSSGSLGSSGLPGDFGSLGARPELMNRSNTVVGI